MAKKIIRLHSRDNVVVALSALSEGTAVHDASDRIITAESIPAGHKIAASNISSGSPVYKYGEIIGYAVSDIAAGSCVHTHNMKTGLSGVEEYEYKPKVKPVVELDFEMPELRVFRRKNGDAGIRNELWVLPTVGCVNGVADEIIEGFKAENDTTLVDGVYSFSHPFGCSQLGEDHERTRRILQNIAVHPNAGGVLVLGLGCENNQVSTFRETMPEGWDPDRIIFLEAQSVDDEVKAGIEILESLYKKASKDERVTGSIADLRIGLECGGSDAFSGITANPLIGMLSDYIIQHGGTTVLTEVPEMFGAEHILFEQCADKTVFDKAVKMINGYKQYYLSHNQPVYENPSPGNKKGGITTLEDKSLGCTKKAGSSIVSDVIDIDQRISLKGLNLLASPGNDIVATTVLGTAGCQLVLFSTGRGNPLGGFIPTAKVSTNTDLMRKKPHWIDFDAGVIAEGDVPVEDVLTDFICKAAEIVNGSKVRAEERRSRDISIFKTGVIL